MNTMISWMMAHPWMTLVLALGVLAVLNNAVYWITQAVRINIRHRRYSPPRQSAVKEDGQ